MQSNGIIKLGLVKSLGLYCNLAPNKSQKSKQKLVSGFQINFLCIDPDQVNPLKDLRGGIQKIWEFHLPYYVPSTFRRLLLKTINLYMSVLSIVAKQLYLPFVWTNYAMMKKQVRYFGCQSLSDETLHPIIYRMKNIENITTDRSPNS